MKKQILRLFKGSLIYGLGNVLNMFFGLLLLPLFTSYLNPKDFGIIANLNLFSIFISAIFTLGFGTSISVVYYDLVNKDKRTLVVSTAFITMAFSLLLMVFLGFLFSGYIGILLFNTRVYRIYILIMILQTLFQNLIMPFLFKFQFEERQKAYVIVNSISLIITLGITAVFVVILHYGIMGYVLGFTLGEFFSLIIIGSVSLKKIPIKLNRKIMFDLIRQGLPMIPSFFCIYVFQQGNVFFITKLSSLHEAGLYSIGMGFASAIMVIISAITTAWGPFFLSFIDKKENINPLFGRIFTYYIYGVGLLSLFFYVFAKPVIIIFTAKQYFNAYQIIGLLATANFALGIFYLLLPPIYFAKEIKYTTLILFLAMMIFIASSFILIPIFGMIGACISLIIGYVVVDVFMFLFNKINIKKKNYIKIDYEWKRILPFLIIYVLLILFTFIKKPFSFFWETIISSSILIFVILILYLSLDKAEKEEIKKLIFFVNNKT